MGIVNITPDSFSDGGHAFPPLRAIDHARALVRSGAHLLDLGGESTRPGSFPVPVEEELIRVLPVIEQCATEFSIPLSVDTSKARVAELALARGASIINDVTALRGDPELARVIANLGAGVVVMHMRGEPATMQHSPQYRDVVSEVLAFLDGRISWCETHGIPRCRIAVDPGIGFGKTTEHNLLLLQNLSRFTDLGCALLVGTSRKGFLGTLTDRDVSGRMAASIASSLAACTEGARVVRVHDVAAMVDAIKVWTGIKGWGETA
jgi:dihydropteroate synthase